MANENDTFAPLVSVVMPCFNHARFIAESVRAILKQSHTHLELIIIDDRSSDDSWNIISDFATTEARIRAIRHARNLGAAQSRNSALRMASGDYIAFCDADDVWEEDKLASQTRLLQTNPDFDVAYCDALIVNKEGSPTGRTFSEMFPPPKPNDGYLFEELVRRNFINIQCALLRNVCIKRVEGFDKNIKWVEDWWFWIQLSRHCRFLYSAEPLARYRVHDQSTNKIHKKGYAVNRFRVLRRIIRGFPDLPVATRADVIFNMGVSLCEAGKYLVGRRLLWDSLRFLSEDLRALKSCVRAMRRLLMDTARRSWLPKAGY